MAKATKAIVRDQVEKIDGVSRTWIEWADEGKILVVEVDFDTDPESKRCRPDVLEEIKQTTKDALQHQTTMAINGLRIIPKKRWRSS
jgi:hypothetical protein